ncbi:MAG: hypothetical protein EA406_00180 [Rhodospirillales bacterium]|nr:MAG: hypothetical protein EA406_00180 [Rhodospirillales bacterium]
MALINAVQNHAAYIGATAVDAVYAGSTVVWGDVVTYTAMRARSADPTDPFRLTGTSAAGTFTATTTDAADNGGTVIDSATPGVKWVRDGTYNTPESPMLLSWFERTKDGPLVDKGADISSTVQRIVTAATPEPSAPPPFPYTADTMGMWVFDGNLDEHSEQTFDPTGFHLEAPFPVRLSSLHIPYGHLTLDLAGPIRLEPGTTLGSATEVDQYVPRAKLFGFDPEPFHLEIDHDGLGSVERLRPPTNGEQAITVKVVSAADGTTIRLADGLVLDRLVVEKSGIARNPLRVLVRPQSELPITFLPNCPWRKVVDAPHDPDLIPNDALVFDSLLSRPVFEAKAPDAEPDGHATRVIYTDNWDVRVDPCLSFWYRATDNLTLKMEVITQQVLREPTLAITDDTVGLWTFEGSLDHYDDQSRVGSGVVPWSPIENDNWQQAEIDMAAAVAAQGLGHRIGAFRLSVTNSGGDGYYRLAGWE